MNRISALLLLLCVQSAFALELLPQEPHRYDEQADSKPWKEADLLLPPAPKGATWHQIDVPGGQHRYFLDAGSISAGDDGVVRYTLAIRTSGGAENVLYEGMRCATGGRKVYAFGRDGAWSENRYARWEPIEERRAGSYHKELFFHYFCTVEGPADIKVIRRALARGGLRRGGD